MFTAVRQRTINTVLIKDLSRLGRNYLEVGNLAEVFLPEHGCELISLNEKLDEMMVFRNWFNEQHSRETSKKVKAVKKMCSQSGKFIGAYAPYGYQKSPDDKHLLVPDEFAAEGGRVNRRQTAKELEIRIQSVRESESGVLQWAQQIKECTRLETLDTQTLLMLVERIEVSDAAQIGSRPVRDIKILYRFVGDFNLLTESGGAADERQAV